MLDALNARLSRLGRDEMDSLVAYAARATWPAGFAVYQRGSLADGVFIVVSGRVVLRSRVKAGRAFVPLIASPGETFGAEGLSANARYATEARADAESDTLHMSGVRFRAFLRERPQDALALIGQIVAERTALIEKLRELATLSVEQRLLTTLLRMAQNRTFLAQDGRISLGPAQYRLLCELVGATRESVSLVLGRLVAEGMAERQGSSIVMGPTARLAGRLENVWMESDLAMPIGTTTEVQA